MERVKIKFKSTKLLLTYHLLFDMLEWDVDGIVQLFPPNDCILFEPCPWEPCR